MYKITLPEVELVEYLIEVEDDTDMRETIDLVLRGEGQMHKSWPEGSFSIIEALVKRHPMDETERMSWKVEIEEDTA